MIWEYDNIYLIFEYSKNCSQWPDIILNIPQINNKMHSKFKGHVVLTLKSVWLYNIMSTFFFPH